MTFTLSKISSHFKSWHEALIIAISGARVRLFFFLNCSTKLACHESQSPLWKPTKLCVNQAPESSLNHAITVSVNPAGISDLPRSAPQNEAF